MATFIPSCRKSSCTTVAILALCALLELTRMVNSTGFPFGSNSFPSFHENDAAARIAFAFEIERGGLRNGLVHPQRVAGGYVPPNRLGQPAINKACDRFPINCGGHGPAKGQVSKPSSLEGNLWAFLRSWIIHIEHQELVLQTWARIVCANRG